MAHSLITTLLLLNFIASGVYLLFRGLLFWAKDRVDERFRYMGCIAVMMLFLVPFYRVFPANSFSGFWGQYQQNFSITTAQSNATEETFLQNEQEKEVFHLEPKEQKAVLIIWGMGAATLAGWYLFVFLRFRRKLSSKPIPAAFEALQKTANRCAKEYGLGQMPILRAIPDVQSPMLIGLLKPIIAIPDVGLPLQDAELILKHELVHFKRCDLWWKLLGVLLQTVYWFNPIVWLLCRDFEFCTETSCDAQVVRNLSHDERKHYGHLLISYVQTKHKQMPVLGISFTPAHKKLKRRISVMLKENKSRKLVAVAVACVLAASSFALSAFAAEKQKDTPRTIDGIVANKNETTPSNDKMFEGKVQKELPFAEKIDPNDGWTVENKGTEESSNFDPAQVNLPPLNIPDDFKEAVMRGEVEPFELDDSVTVFTAE